MKLNAKLPAVMALLLFAIGSRQWCHQFADGQVKLAYADTRNKKILRYLPATILDKKLGIPHNIRIFDEHPKRLLSEINQKGCWIILAFRSDGVADIRALAVAYKVAERFSGKVSVGFRMIDHDYADLGQWCLDQDTYRFVPVWAFFKDGKFIKSIDAELTLDEVANELGNYVEK